MVSLDETTLALIGTWALVIGTIALLYWQNLQAQRLHSANAVMALRERFDSPQLRAARRRFASFLLSNTSDNLPDFQVPAFFELMGAMVHRGVLDRRLVWNAFGGWITNYFWALEHPTDRVRGARDALRDPLILAEFEWLTNLMLRMDRHQLGAAHENLLPRGDESRAILGREASLELSLGSGVEAAD